MQLACDPPLENGHAAWQFTLSRLRNADAIFTPSTSNRIPVTGPVLFEGDKPRPSIVPADYDNIVDAEPCMRQERRLCPDSDPNSCSNAAPTQHKPPRDRLHEARGFWNTQAGAAHCLTN